MRFVQIMNKKNSIANHLVLIIIYFSMLLLFNNVIVGRVLELQFLVSQNMYYEWNFVYVCKIVF